MNFTDEQIAEQKRFREIYLLGQRLRQIENELDEKQREIRELNERLKALS